MQLFLPISHNENSFNKDSFITLPENNDAINFLRSFFKNNCTISHFKSCLYTNIIIQGPRFSGKTHILSILAEEFGAKFLSFSQIKNLEFLANLTKNKIYIFEDIDQIDDDEAILRLINFAYEREIFLIFSLQNFTNFNLADLVSRFKSIPIAKIDNLTINSIRDLLQALLINNDIYLSSSKIDFIIKHCQRDYESINNIVQKIVNFNCEFLKQPSLGDLKNILS
jgi:chromosomal replication initiation ATPase DnaA